MAKQPKLKFYDADDLKKAIWAGFAFGFLLGVAVCFVIGYINVTNA